MSARHALSCAEAAAICEDLEQVQHIHVVIDIDAAGVVNLRPQQTVSTAEEVAILALVLATTDARVDWHDWHEGVAL